ERREKSSFLPRNNPQDSVRFSLIRSDFGDHARGRDSDRTIQGSSLVHGAMQMMSGAERRTMQAFGSGEVQISFVDRCHLHPRRETLQHLENFARVFGVSFAMTLDENRLRA